MKPTLCRVSRYSLPGLPEPDDQLHEQLQEPELLLVLLVALVASLVSLSVLPFLMTSGSAAAGAAASAVAAAADSSAFGITTWTSIVSPSVTGFHFVAGGDVAHANRARAAPAR